MLVEERAVAAEQMRAAQHGYVRGYPELGSRFGRW